MAAPRPPGDGERPRAVPDGYGPGRGAPGHDLLHPRFPDRGLGLPPSCPRPRARLPTRGAGHARLRFLRQAETPRLHNPRTGGPAGRADRRARAGPLPRDGPRLRRLRGPGDVGAGEREAPRGTPVAVAVPAERRPVPGDPPRAPLAEAAARSAGPGDRPADEPGHAGAQPARRVRAADAAL